jgi:hypothetical protein
VQSPKEDLDAISELWDEITFEELQTIFLAGMERLQWVIQNGGEKPSEPDINWIWK